jgi:transcriptional regulator with XRE-family HTH domain
VERFLHVQLRQIREGKGVSLRALAKLSGVGLATLSRLEAGQFDPRLNTLRRLALALGVTVTELIGEAHSTKEKQYGSKGRATKR